MFAKGCQKRVSVMPSIVCAAAHPVAVALALTNLSSETLLSIVEAGDPNRVALREPSDGAGLTALALGDEAARLAGALAGAGVGRGDRVALVLPNGPAFVHALLGIT